MARVLVVDDQEALCTTLCTFLRQKGHDPAYALTLSEGLRMARQGAYDVVFLDVMFPDGSGLDVLPRVKAVASSPEVIIMTGYTDPEGAELAVRSGAWTTCARASH